MADLKVYSPEEVAQILRVTRRTVYSYIKSGALKATKIGKYLRIREQDLDSFLTTGTGTQEKGPEE